MRANAEPPPVALPRVVGLTGLAGVGKTTMSDLLIRHYGYTRLKFTEPLKRMLQSIGLTLNDLEGDFKEQPNEILCGRTPRYAMQTLGLQWGRDLIDPEIWVSMWRGLARYELEHGRRLVVDDVRMLNEAVAVRACNGQIWRIIRPGMELRFTHGTELEMARIPFDLRFNNDGRVSDLHKLVDIVLKGEPTHG